MNARACVAFLSLLLLAFAVSAGAALAHGGRPAREAGSPTCHGKARRLRPGHVSFSFSCGGEDVTAFVIRADRALRSVYDPSYAFACERSTSRSFDCGDIHSGAGSEGSGVASVSEPLCRAGQRLMLRITATLNFEQMPSATFALRGPC